MPRGDGTDQNLTRPDRFFPSGPPEIEEARAGAQSRAEPRERTLHGGGWCLGARVVGGAVFARAAIDDDACLLHADHTLRRLDGVGHVADPVDRKSTRLNSSHGYISYAVFCLK